MPGRSVEESAPPARHGTSAAPGVPGGVPAVPEPRAPEATEPAAPARAVLRRADLHGSVSDPVLDTMNFLN
jgi:(S)-3,5-dihydroxyphenylglycine transaminase